MAIKHVVATGDGPTDTAAILAAVAGSDTVVITGQAVIDEPIVLSSHNRCLFGVGHGGSKIVPSDNTFPAIKLDSSVDHVTVGDLEIIGGMHGIQLDNVQRVTFDNVKIRAAASHGVYGRGGVWIVRFMGGAVNQCGGDGINMRDTGSSGGDSNGNAVLISGTMIEQNAGHGVTWGANGLAVVGATIEGNDDTGLHIVALEASASGVSVTGCYFENNAGGEIEFEVNSGYYIFAPFLAGNVFITGLGTKSIIASGTGVSKRILQMTIDKTNKFSQPSQQNIDLGGYVGSSIIHASRRVNLNCTNPQDNRIFYSTNREPQVEKFTVDCSADQTASEKALLSLPSRSIIHNIHVECTEAFNGTGTKTFEIGISGNPDKYIDQADFDPTDDSTPSTAAMIGGSGDQATEELLTSPTDIVATVTNTGGTPTTGEVDVWIHYTMRIDVENSV